MHVIPVKTSDEMLAIVAFLSTQGGYDMKIRRYCTLATPVEGAGGGNVSFLIKVMGEPCEFE